jgi:LAS superfamily LD-carboxypeptidase LdcB
MTLCFSQNVSAAPTVVIEGEPVLFKLAPFIDNGRIQVPLRDVFEAVGAEVRWDGKAHSITAEKDSTEIKIIIGGRAFIDGQEVKLNTPARIIEGYTMVPLRFAAESMDCKVDWNGATETVTISSNTSGTIIKPFSSLYDDHQKAQFYLSKMGFITGNYESKNNSEQVVLTASSIILFQYKMGLRITGQFDTDTKAALEQCIEGGWNYDDIMKLEGKRLQPLSDNPEDNGRLSKNIMTVIPVIKERKAFLPEITAVGWATLVQAAAKDPKNNMDRFLLKSWDSGYRSYEEQVSGFNTKGPALNAKPGTSPHGWGIGIDLNTSDPQTGRAQSIELRWLEKHAAELSFTPCNRAVDGGRWEPYFPDGGINFYETWHWNYRPE